MPEVLNDTIITDINEPEQKVEINLPTHMAVLAEALRDHHTGAGFKPSITDIIVRGLLALEVEARETNKHVDLVLAMTEITKQHKSDSSYGLKSIDADFRAKD